MNWKTITADEKHREFVYACAAGHSWTRSLDTYEADNFGADGQRLPNNCPTCEEKSSVPRIG